jgi:hypothetical protein
MVRTCRECGDTSEKKRFKKGKNLCLDCSNTYMRNWYAKNSSHVKEYRSQPEVRESRKAAVRKAVQRSPEAFLRTLWHHVRKHSKSKRKHLKKAILVCTVTYQDLLDLWESQQGRCALTNMPMDHVFNSLKTVSVDRIDSSEGYVPNNVQLVCKWVNLAKQDHTNADMLAIIEELRK